MKLRNLFRKEKKKVEENLKEEDAVISPKDFSQAYKTVILYQNKKLKESLAKDLRDGKRTKGTPDPRNFFRVGEVFEVKGIRLMVKSMGKSGVSFGALPSIKK